MKEKTARQNLFQLDRTRILVSLRSGCKKSVFLTLLILGLLSWTQGAQTQEYPVRPITLLIGNPPGAGTDVCSRILAQEATKILGQEIIPVNKPGGGGAVAVGILAKSKPDGYTLAAVTSSCLTSISQLESVPYDPLRDIIPILHFGSVNAALIVRSDSPHKSFKELIEYARNNPGKVSYGTPAIGTPSHLFFEKVLLEEKVDIPVIPFGGATPTVTALLGGHVSCCGSSTSGFLQHFRAGKVRVLLTMTEKRIEVVPDAPTFIELGYPNGIFTMELYIILVPKGTPPEFAKKLEEAFQKARGTQTFRDTAERFYMYVQNPLTSQDLRKSIEEAYAKHGEIIRKAKLTK